MKNKLLRSFTVLEMLLVLTIITVVFILTLPNIQQKREIINKKGCEALIEVVNSQILLYELENGDKSVSIDALINEGYLKDKQSQCPDGTKISIRNGQAYNE
jgi:Competence protein ComGC